MAGDNTKRLIAARAATELRRRRLSLAFDAEDLDSRPTDQQQEVFDALGKLQVRVVFGGNRCLAEGTLVTTPEGPKAIEDIKPGDTVFDEYGLPAMVLKTFRNGKKVVNRIKWGDIDVWATKEHKWLTLNKLCVSFENTRRLWIYRNDVDSSGRIDSSYVYAEMTSESKMVQTYDIHIDTPTNLYMLANGLITHNSGKSQIPARELGWILTDTHPTWTNPWGTTPLLILVAAQDLTGAETELWNNKLKKFIDPSEWKEVRQGQTLKKAIHKTKGHQIVFLSHANSSEEDIKHLQMYTAHYVWIDEAPKSVRVFEELLNRVSTTGGSVIASMTLKRRDGGTRKLRHYLEKLCNGTIGRIFQLSRLKNPKFADKAEEEIAKLAGLSEDLRQAILEGTPVGDDLLVFEVPEAAVGRPDGYHPSWRHILSVDPATESKCGVTVWAESPKDGVWWCVKAKYIEGVRVPSVLVETVENEVKGLNVYKRIYDTAASWYANQARYQDYIYLPVVGKADRNADMIANLQQALGTDIKIAEWCTLLLDEFEICQRSETDDSKIANAKKYHLIDSAKYFNDTKPKREIRPVYASHDDFLIQHDDKMRKKEHERKQAMARRVMAGRLFKPRMFTR